jgi:hypothetical protein
MFLKKYLTICARLLLYRVQVGTTPSFPDPRSAHTARASKKGMETLISVQLVESREVYPHAMTMRRP